MAVHTQSQDALVDLEAAAGDAYQGHTAPAAATATTAVQVTPTTTVAVEQQLHLQAPVHILHSATAEIQATAVTDRVKQATEDAMLLQVSAQTQAEEAIRDHLPCEVLRIQARLQRHDESLDSIHGQLSQLTRTVVQLSTAMGITLVQDRTQISHGRHTDATVFHTPSNNSLNSTPHTPYSSSSVHTTQQPLPSKATAEPPLAIHVPHLPLSTDTQNAFHVWDGMPVYDVYGAEDNCCPTCFINVLDVNLEQQQDEEGFAFSTHDMDFLARSTKLTNEKKTLSDSMPVYDVYDDKDRAFPDVFSFAVEQQPHQVDNMCNACDTQEFSTAYSQVISRSPIQMKSPVLPTVVQRSNSKLIDQHLNYSGMSDSSSLHIWDPGIASLYYPKLHMLPGIQRDVIVPVQRQIQSKSITSLWEFSFEKDVQMQWDPGKDNKKFNYLIPALCNSRFNAIHYCQIFEKCINGIALWLIHFPPP